MKGLYNIGTSVLDSCMKTEDSFMVEDAYYEGVIFSYETRICWRLIRVSRAALVVLVQHLYSSLQSPLQGRLRRE